MGNSIPSVAEAQRRRDRHYRKYIRESILKKSKEGCDFLMFDVKKKEYSKFPNIDNVLNEFRKKGYYIEYDEKTGELTVSWSEDGVMIRYKGGCRLKS